MKLNRRLNQLSEAEYQHLLANYRRYTDFNSLGLFRSLLENEKLDEAQRLRLRDAAIEVFPKFYEFLQLKDPHTYLHLQALGLEQTQADKQAAWEQVRRHQQRLLADKGIRHRNLGVHARHNCGHLECACRGVMTRPESILTDSYISFPTDHRNTWQNRRRADRRHKDKQTFRAARRTRFPEDL